MFTLFHSQYVIINIHHGRNTTIIRNIKSFKNARAVYDLRSKRFAILWDGRESQHLNNVPDNCQIIAQFVIETGTTGCIWNVKLTMQ